MKRKFSMLLVVLLAFSFAAALIDSVKAGEEITNGGFEDDFTGWTNSGADISTSEYYSGAKSAHVSYSCSFYQTLSVDLDDVVSFTVMAKKAAGSGNTWIGYTTDAGSDNFLLFDGTSDAVDWTEVDILGEIEDDDGYGTLTEITVTRMSDYFRDFWFDDFSLITEGGVMEGAYNLDYYFRSDTYETLGVSAYGLDSDYTNTYLMVNVTYPLVYGFRVWLVSSSTVSEELTDEEPEARIYLEGSETYDSYSNTWECPESTVNLGYQALKVVVYTSEDEEEWTAIANYISPVLITKKIESSTWTFTLQVEFDGGNAVYSWGDADHRSGVSGISFTEPLESEVQLWRVNSGDYIGFILASYIAVIGEAFYVLILVLIGGVFYYRYRNFGVIAFFFSLFGGMGGLAWFLVPPWAATVVSILVIVGTSFIVWRVIR